MIFVSFSKFKCCSEENAEKFLAQHRFHDLLAINSFTIIKYAKVCRPRSKSTCTCTSFAPKLRNCWPDKL